MQIVLNEELKEALEWTCGLVKDYAVDVDVSIYADGEIRISITPTYRDQINQNYNHRSSTNNAGDFPSRFC